MDFVTPSGFRDILPEEARQREEIVARVQRCYAERGYDPVETPTLERLDVMQAAGHVPAAPFKMFDAAGDVLALRPDVTMQVARMAATRLRGQGGPFKLRYTQRIFREDQPQAGGAELTQIGIENIGEAGPGADAEIVGLFAQSLRLAGVPQFKIALGTVAVLRSLLEESGAPQTWRRAVLEAYHASNFRRLGELCAAPDAPAVFADAIGALPYVRGDRAAIDRARELAAPLGCDAGLDALARTFDALAAAGLEDDLLIDFSIMTSFDYYTGIVFEAYVPGSGAAVGSGGRYDGMLAAYDGAPSPAAGFAFSLEAVMAAQAGGGAEEGGAVPGARPLRIAVPKGSLYEDAVRLLGEAGLPTAGLDDPGRQLVIRNPGVDYIIVRPTDAPVFIARGAADCGICGKDSLAEAALDVVELADLRFGGCAFVVAEPAGATAAVEERYRRLGSIRVATKYPRITRAYYERAGQQVEVVKMHGNIELAPLTGMADRIVDITATGATLKQNNLVVVDQVMPSTARFSANPCAFRTDERVVALAHALQRAVDVE